MAVQVVGAELMSRSLGPAAATLLVVATQPHLTIREIAHIAGIEEAIADSLVKDLTAAGVVQVKWVEEEARHFVNIAKLLDHPLSGELGFPVLIKTLAGSRQQIRADSFAGRCRGVDHVWQDLSAARLGAWASRMPDLMTGEMVHECAGCHAVRIESRAGCATVSPSADDIRAVEKLETHSQPPRRE